MISDGLPFALDNKIEVFTSFFTEVKGMHL